MWNLDLIYQVIDKAAAEAATKGFLSDEIRYEIEQLYKSKNSTKRDIYAHIKSKVNEIRKINGITSRVIHIPNYGKYDITGTGYFIVDNCICNDNTFKILLPQILLCVATYGESEGCCTFRVAFSNISNTRYETLDIPAQKLTSRSGAFTSLSKYGVFFQKKDSNNITDYLLEQLKVCNNEIKMLVNPTCHSTPKSI